MNGHGEPDGLASRQLIILLALCEPDATFFRTPMSNPYQSPPNYPNPQYPQYPHGQGDATGGVIPYKNPYALIAYYVGIGSLLSCIVPIPIGIVAVVLGIIGLKKRAENPVIKGSVHAWIGIVLGGITTLFSILAIVMVVIALNSRP